jgi:hypothetical protein
MKQDVRKKRTIRLNKIIDHFAQKKNNFVLCISKNGSC